MIVLMLGVPMALLALFHLVLPFVTPRFGDRRGAFHLQDGVWTPSPQVSGGLWGLKVSSHGAVWTISVLPRGLCRLDGDRWTCYGRKQFGSRTDWLRGGFALRGEEVWGALEQGAVRFDGQSWRLYADALKTRRPSAIVAGPSGVWMVDDDANLSHFDGGSWTIRSLNGVMPDAQPAGTAHPHRNARLEMTGDGRLWVSWRGLWRQDGETWREVRSPGLNLAEVWPIGHDAEYVWLWLWRTNEVAAVAPDGRIVARHGVWEMGLTANVLFNGLAASNGRICIATSSGLLTFGDGRWRNQGLPPGSVTITDVALAPDGSAWALAETRSRAPAWYYWLRLAADFIPLVVLGLFIAAWLQGRAENILAAEQALVAAAGDLPGVGVANSQADIDRQARSVKWALCAVLVALALIPVAVDEAERRVWPGAPAWPPRAGALAFVLACFGIWFWTSRRLRSVAGNAEQPQPSRFWEAAWGPAKFLIVCIVIVVGVIPWDWMDRLIHIAALAWLVNAAVVVIPPFLIIGG